MEGRYINSEIIRKFQKKLIEEEKSNATIEKYIRDVTAFVSYLDDSVITKNKIIAYKQYLLDKNYAARSINSMLASINSMLCFLGWTELKVKSLKVQQQAFCMEEKELTRAEYERLCQTAMKKNNERLCLILQTICSTGIRVSELQFITVEAVREGKAVVSLKGKIRAVFLMKKLQRKLLRYISEQKICEGCVFVTRTGKPISRSNIWREMKGLCMEANVDPRKVFPHNLRHLFARIFYGLEKDIARLADVLGHSSVNTTRIYIVSNGSEHRHCMERMRLVI